MMSRQVALVAALAVALLACPIEVRTRPDDGAVHDFDATVQRDSDGAVQRDSDGAVQQDSDGPAQSDSDGAVLSQVLKILTTKDDGEVSGGKLLFSGETLWGNLIHAGSWATSPTISHAFLRYRITTALPPGVKITSAKLRVFGHALTNNSQWSPTLHKLIVSADRVPDAPQLASKDAVPDGAAGVLQTQIVDWGQITWKPDAWNTSPNLSAIVQELVDSQGGLKDGAYLQLWLRAPEIYPVNAELPFEDLDHLNGKAASLTLEWVPAR